MPFRYVLALSISAGLLQAQNFEIRVPGQVPRQSATVQYSLSSPLRTRNSWAVSNANEAVRISTRFDDGTLAQTIQAMIVVPGCESAAVDARLSQTGDGGFDFTCRRLPYVSMEGLFLKPDVIARALDRVLDIEVDYLPGWMKSLPRMRIPVARAELRPDGRFTVVGIPDFTKDPIARDSGSLQIWARDRASGADFAQLRTAQRTKDADRTGNLALGPLSQSPVEFVPCLVGGKAANIDLHTHFAIRGASYSCDIP